MGREPSQRALEVFKAALGRTSTEQEAYLAHVCAGDKALRAEVEQLLAADARETFLKAPPGLRGLAAASGELVDGLVGRVIGRYRIVRRIATGGMGTVYEAIQEQPKRSVALKMVRAGLASDAALRRFVHEAEVLARLRHPAIAQVYEAGSHDGVPFFAMEYIPGAKTLTRFSTDKQLSTHQRMEMFADVCDAIHHGHQRGIIHRDLKPSNILVDDAGRPKVIDFGVARATDADMTIATLQTDVGQLVGTLRYMSPEQCEGDSAALDTRSDVYALGVVLYELLTGELPYDVTISSPFEMPRVIREEDPRRLSSINRSLRGDVETIVLKALEKDRERRYQSASDLAADIRRYLRREPIEARSNSRLYVLRKQVWRYRTPLAVATGFVLLLIASSVVAWSLYFESQQRLWDSYLSQAQARRWSGKAGCRIESLKALAQAASIRPSAELRDEAIACLALADVRVTEKWSSTFGLHMPYVDFDDRFDRFILWERQTGKSVVRRLGGNQNLLTLPAADSPRTLTDPRFSHDGKYVARAADSACEIWDIETKQLVARIGVTASGFAALDFKPDDTELAVGTQSGEIYICDVQSGQLRVLPPTGVPAEAVCFSPSADRLSVTSPSSRDALVRNTRTGDVIHTLSHPGAVWGRAEWTPDEKLLATGCADHNVRVWDAESGELRLILEGHTNVPTRVGFNCTGELLFSSAWDGTTRLWDPGDGIDLLVLSGTGFRFSTDAPELAFWTHDKGPRTYTVAQVDANDAFRSLYDRPAKAGPDWPQSVAVDGDGWLVASTSKAGLRLWDLSRGRAIAYLPIGLTHSALFLPDGSALITIAPRRVLRWPLQRDGHVLHVGPPENVLPDLQGDFGRGCLSTDGSTLVLSMNRDHALVIDLHNTSERRTIGPHAGLCSLSLSPDNRWLATGAWKGSDAKVWDFASGELTQVIPTPSHVEVGIGRDGRWLVTSETEYVLWEMETWRSVARFPRPEYLDLPGMVAFSPDGQFLAAISKAGTIDLVDLAHREMVANLECPLPLDIRALSITPDGTRILLTGREGHILHIWDLRVVRENLAAIGLDWDLPPYPPRENAVTPPPLRASISSGLSSVAAMSAATSG